MVYKSSFNVLMEKWLFKLKKIYASIKYADACFTTLKVWFFLTFKGILGDF